MGHGQDEICKAVAEQGGLDTVLQFLDQAIQTGNKVVAKSACALLSQVFSHALLCSVPVPVAIEARSWEEIRLRSKSKKCPTDVAV
jgi:hypothetical protein